MRHDNQFYRIDLEDYSDSHHNSVLRAYFGTMDDIRTLIFHLSEGQGTATRYQDTIEAFDRYTLDPETVHTIAWQDRPILTPCSYLHHTQSKASNLSWYHRSTNGGVYRLNAASAEVNHLLVQQNDLIHRCVRVKFHQLGYHIPFIGSAVPDDSFLGFPGQIRYQGKHIHAMTLYMHLQTYSSDQCMQALLDTKHLSRGDWSQVCHNMIGAM